MIEKSSAVPESDTDCEPPAALSVTFIVALRAPPAAGLNATLIVHEPLGLMLAVQLSVSENSAGFVPLNEMLLADRDAAPVFVSVTGRTALDVPTNCAGNERLAGERLAVVPRPVPLSDIHCGLPTALS